MDDLWATETGIIMNDDLYDEEAEEAAYFDRISRRDEIMGFHDPSPLDHYDPEFDF